MKRFLVLILTVCMALPLAVFAEADEELKKAILTAKEVIEIPEDYTEFNYNLRDREGRKSWNLSWEDKERNKGRIGVYITDAGDILNYSNYVYDEKKGELITMEEAIEIARGFTAKLLGEKFSVMRLENEKNIPLNSYSNAFCIDFARYENDIPVYGQKCRVSVDKFSGRVENYSGFAYDRKSVFENPDKLIGMDKGISAFVQGEGMTLAYRVYRSFYGEDKELKVFPVYRHNGREYVIDAQTGEMLLMEKLLEEAENNDVFLSADSAAGALKNEAALSPQEQAAVEELSGLIAEKDAREILEKAVPEFKNHKFSASSLYRRYAGGFVMNLEYYDDEHYFGNASIDAENGEILSFNFSTYRLETQGKIPTAEDVEEFAKTLAGEKFDKCEPGENEKNYYSFNRMENGIPVENNGITVSVDDEKGYICGYNLMWDKIEKFPELTGIKTKEEVLGIVAEKNNLGLCYINGGLVYGIFGQGSYDPFSGALLNYKGEETEEKKVPQYTDIEGHWCEETVTRMVENGFFFGTDKFGPDETVTQRDFVKMTDYMSNYQDDDVIEDSIKSMQYFDEVDLDAPVTRKEAAKVFAMKLGYGEVAAKYELFKLPFSDCAEDEFVGYIALCKAYGIMKGNADGTFGSDSQLTRAEVVTMIYRNMCR